MRLVQAPNVAQGAGDLAAGGAQPEYLAHGKQDVAGVGRGAGH
jgi:hypothetical protein